MGATCYILQKPKRETDFRWAKSISIINMSANQKGNMT